MTSIKLSVAGIVFEIWSDIPILIGNDIERFLTGNDEVTMEKYLIKSLDGNKKIEFDTNLKDAIPEYKDEFVSVYNEASDRIFKYRMNRHNREAEMYAVKENDATVLYADELFEDMFVSEGKVYQYLSLDDVLLKYNAFYLHSSIVATKNGAIVFSGASGAGKSTQAELWRKYGNAKVLNGDKTIIRKMDDGYYGFGSPFAGSSGIFVNEGAKVKAIVFPDKYHENKIKRLTKKQAFLSLYGQSLFRGITKSNVSHGVRLLQHMTEELPVLYYACTKDEKAVDILNEYISLLT